MTLRRLLLVLAPLLSLACKKDLVCPRGEVDCGGRCVPLASDAANCGACGHACGPRAYCGAGACACEAGATGCGGVCTDLASDPRSCGACGSPCDAALVCSASTCQGACAAGLTDCARACVDVAVDSANCGACGRSCGPGERCQAGACQALYAACFNTNEIARVTASLAHAASISAGDGPLALALGGDVIYTVNTGFGATSAGIPSVAAYATDGGNAGFEVTFPAYEDLESLRAWRDVLLVSDATANAVLVFDPAVQDVVGAVALATGTDSYPNPHGIAVVGDVAYVALAGSDQLAGGQQVAIIDFSSVDACRDPSSPACADSSTCDAGRSCVRGRCQIPCGTVTGRVDLASAADASGKPFPWNVLAAGDKAYVTLGNMTPGDWTKKIYRAPAGHGKLAVLQGGALASPTSIVDLGAGCANADAITANGDTLWVSCSWEGTPAVVPVDVSGAAPVVGAPLDLSAVPGSAPHGIAPAPHGFTPAALTFCGGAAYVGDLWSGRVARVDAAGAITATAEVCPANASGDAVVADLACSW